MLKKQIVSAILSATLIASLVSLAGCGGNADRETTTENVPETTLLLSEEAKPSETVSVPTATESVQAENISTEAASEEEAGFKVPETVEEIVDYFNNSANGIKINAVKVVKNYEKRIIDKENLVVPSALQSVAESLIDTFMKDDTEPIVYDTKEEIRNEYIVPNQDYVSMLKPEYVEKATCIDNGETVEIYLKLKDETNPTAGKGVAAVCDVIEAYEVSDKVSFIEEFTTEYRGCEVRYTIDKASGRAVKAWYSTPLILDVTVNMFGTHRASVGLTFVKDYTITY